MALKLKCFTHVITCEPKIGKQLLAINNNETTWLNICQSGVLQELTKVSPFNYTSRCNPKHEIVNPQCDFEKLDSHQLCSGLKMIDAGQYILFLISCVMAVLWAVLILKIHCSSDTRFSKQSKLTISYLQLVANISTLLMYVSLTKWLWFPRPLYLTYMSSNPVDYKYAGELMMYINFYAFFQVVADSSRYLSQV